MGKRKPVSILKRKASGDADKPSKRTKRAESVHQGDASAPHKLVKKSPSLFPISQTHRRAVNAVARLLDADATGKDGATLKSLTLAPHIENKRAVYAVAVETLKHVPVLEKLVDSVDELCNTPGLPRPVAYVLVRELLWGEGLQPTGPAERAILKCETSLRMQLQRLLDDAGVDAVSALLPATALAEAAARHPRTARVNELKMSVDEALSWVREPPHPHTRKWKRAGRNVTIDEHLPELLVFPPGTDLHDHPLVESGALILQSKSSCMPARALNPTPAWKVLDGCAAPGNKTTHVAALLRGTGSVIACDKDPKRLQRLVANAEKAGAAGIIHAQCVDFLSVDPSSPQYASVDAILLDPSCSGSGTAVSRMDYLLPSAASRAMGAAAVQYRDTRVEALASFQINALSHALKFPGVKRVVYSTCSLHAAENEEVVAAVVEDASKAGFKLVAALPTWPRRGIEVPGKVRAEDAALLMRTDPLEDGTDGFFVALFERTVGNSKEKKPPR